MDEHRHEEVRGVWRARISPWAWILGASLLASCGNDDATPDTGPATPEVTEPSGPSAPGPDGAVPLHVPDRSTIPEGPLGDAVRRGEQIVSHTYEELPDNVGNGLHCTSCHLQGGTVAKAAPWVGITGIFPQYRTRNARVITIESRINACFQRSMNGAPLDPAGEDMAAIVAYMTWLSRDVPIGHPIEGRGMPRIQNRPTPDREHGRALYTEKCAVCHGENGAGRLQDDGSYQFPPLWGERSYNLGAGMARLNTAAAFVRWNMPLGQGGTLTEQEAYDVADFFIHQDRPGWEHGENDWPNGDRPSDARY